MTTAQPYPEKTFGGNMLEVNNPPAACLFCKKILTPGILCRFDRGFYVCDKEKCFAALAGAIEGTRKGPKWMDPLLTHLQFQDRNRSRFWSGEPPLSWEDWAKIQGDVRFRGSRQVAVFNFAEFWQTFVNRYKKENP